MDSYSVLHEMVTIWCVLVLLLAAATGSETQCSASTSRVEFTVTSVKNGTTHRDVAASLLSEVPADSQEPQPVALKVAHWTQRCGGTETVTMDVSTASSILAENRQNSPYGNTATSGTTTTPASVTMASSPTPAPPTPGPDYRLIPGFGFYKFSSDLMTWSEGRRFCEGDRAQMVILRSKKEIEEVKKIWAAYFWTGVYRENPESEFITVTGSRLDESMNALWHTTRPDRTSGDCVAADTVFSNPHIYNVLCNETRKVVCFKSS